MVMKAGDLVSLSFGQLMVSHGVPLCFFGEKKRTRTGSWPLLSYAPWVLQLLSEFAESFISLSFFFTVFTGTSYKEKHIIACDIKKIFFKSYFIFQGEVNNYFYLYATTARI